MRNTIVRIKQPIGYWEQIESLCLRDARRYVAKAVEQSSGRSVREVEIGALTDLVGGLMAQNARLGARLDAIEERGLINTIRRWWAR